MFWLWETHSCGPSRCGYRCRRVSWPTSIYVRMRRKCHNRPTVSAGCNELVQKPQLTDQGRVHSH